jgi:hypothetical protein
VGIRVGLRLFRKTFTARSESLYQLCYPGHIPEIVIGNLTTILQQILISGSNFDRDLLFPT